MKTATTITTKREKKIILTLLNWPKPDHHYCNQRKRAHHLLKTTNETSKTETETEKKYKFCLKSLHLWKIYKFCVKNRRKKSTESGKEINDAVDERQTDRQRLSSVWLLVFNNFILFSTPLLWFYFLCVLLFLFFFVFVIVL